MRIAATVQDSIVDGPGFRFTVFVQGCGRRCPGCHNPETHDPAGGSEHPVEELVSRMLSNPLTDGLTLSGGEPFEQPEECLMLARVAHENGLNVWSYSGFTYEQLLRGTPAQQALLRELDVLVDGPFLLEQRTLSLPWRGSRNQRLISVPQSLATGQTVLLRP
ncbi:anaerobic ribonucleoside-triphosphate reductase activating protein [Oscillibacter sp. MSJ-2]|uniref:Anaerobic ribonucleoside-triphosphate reductase-activating protein n=1 Tax=Dysosmobacter acutus TaxID=2841504 RepID=A0ABS6F9F4_9FIRM|nr:anaerobic ribonucleoside-triphosphate reductase activating protein [Dysosmobacter acutus]MBU5626927.1 anaerobic ribonucleoside-triphosphate reductase activating protein [Dysosmobacter acutus]